MRLKTWLWGMHFLEGVILLLVYLPPESASHLTEKSHSVPATEGKKATVRPGQTTKRDKDLLPEIRRSQYDSFVSKMLLENDRLSRTELGNGPGFISPEMAMSLNLSIADQGEVSKRIHDFLVATQEQEKAHLKVLGSSGVLIPAAPEATQQNLENLRKSLSVTLPEDSVRKLMSYLIVDPAVHGGFYDTYITPEAGENLVYAIAEFKDPESKRGKSDHSFSGGINTNMFFGRYGKVCDLKAMLTDFQNGKNK